MADNWWDHEPPLCKDLYLQHPEPSLQVEEFCWGNLEAAHPVLGRRSDAEVEEFRTGAGLTVHTVRGRPAPKPFQTFRETSFPHFVVDLAFELFTEAAVPFPVQAQTWPCALSGMDTIAVAPTGSGKTLAFLLPALVHLMCQAELEEGDGPIVLVLAPHRELAEQTARTAMEFCSRSTRQIGIRTGVVYGGVDVAVQLPKAEAPDKGRWPEILVATPGRCIELLKRKKMSPRRISYVVLDEADLLISRGLWLPQVQTVLSYIRPDRQLIMCSATWSAEAEDAAMHLTEGSTELVKIKVDPAVPPIPQEVKLFHGASHESLHDSIQMRKQALVHWLRSELRAEESVVIFCQRADTADDLAKDSDILRAVEGSVACAVGNDSGAEGDAYQKLVQQQARVLFTTFQKGSRGLDYKQSLGRLQEAQLSLVVLLFDFPFALKEYAHCIGRTQRPGHAGGRAISFLPEDKFWIACELAGLLEQTRQPVPSDLQALVTEDRCFIQDLKAALARMGSGDPPIPAGDTPGVLQGSHYNPEKGLWTLPASWPSYRRKLLHFIADEVGIPHVSKGEYPNRKLYLATAREELPEKFFLLGEAVDVSEPNRYKWQGRVTDPKILRHRRTIQVEATSGRYAGRTQQVSVDHVWLVADANDS